MADGTKVGSIYYDVSLDDSKFQGSLQGLGKGLEGVGKQMENIGRKMTTTFTLPIIAALGGAAKAAIDFEDSFAGIRKTVDASEAEFAKLSDNIRNLAKVTPTSVNELNRIGELAGQLGIKGVDNLTKFIDTIAQIAVTTNLTSEEAATSFAQIANIMQEPISNIDKMGSVVVDLGNKFATTEREISEFGLRIAGAGKIAGLTTREVFAIGGAMASVGVEAEAGGTAVQKVLIGINTAVVTGNEDLAIFAKTAGWSAQEFATIWKDTPGEAFTAFVQGLGKQGDEAIVTLQELGLEDQRLIRSFLSLANAGDLLNDSMTVANVAWRENRALAEEAEKRYKTTASQLQIFKNNMYDLGITVGSIILPAINNLIKSLAPLIQKFAAFADAHPTFMKIAIAIALVVAAAGPLIFILGTVATMIGLLLSPIGLLVIAIIGIVAVIIAVYIAIRDNLEGIKAAFWGFVNGVKGAIDGFVEAAKIKFQEFLDFLISIGVFLWSIVMTISAPIRWIYTNVVEPIFLLIQAIINRVMYEIFNFLLSIWNSIKDNVITPITNAIKNVINTVWEFIKGITTSAWNWIKEHILTPITEAKAGVDNKTQSILDKVTDIWNKIVGFLRGIASSIVSAITQPFIDAKNKVEEIANAIRSAAEKINPFHRESPSLVDNVTRGVAEIIKQYEKLTGLSFLSPNAAFGYAGARTGGVTEQNINIYVDKVGDMQDIHALGRELGYRAGLE